MHHTVFFVFHFIWNYLFWYIYISTDWESAKQIKLFVVLVSNKSTKILELLLPKKLNKFSISYLTNIYEWSSIKISNPIQIYYCQDIVLDTPKKSMCLLCFPLDPIFLLFDIVQYYFLFIFGLVQCP